MEIKTLERTTYDKLKVGEIFALDMLNGNGFMLFEKMEDNKSYEIGCKADQPIWGNNHIPYMEEDGIYKLPVNVQNLFRG